MNKFVITKAGNTITGVYLSADLIGDVQIETLDYDNPLEDSDEKIEEEIDSERLIKIG
jgi:hypothetical protein